MKIFKITLIEIILMLTFSAIVGAIILRVYWEFFDTPSDPISQNVLKIENALKLYKLDNGFYPTTEQGLQALVEKPTTDPTPKHWSQYLKNIPENREHKPYHYESVGKDKFKLE